MPQVLRVVPIHSQLVALSAVPPLHVHNKEKSNEKIKLKNRKKAPRLCTPPPNTVRHDSDEEDSDNAPSSDDEVGDATERSNRKRHRNQACRHASSPAVAPHLVLLLVLAWQLNRRRGLSPFDALLSNSKKLLELLMIISKIK
jgi:hypothetical protein